MSDDNEELNELSNKTTRGYMDKVRTTGQVEKRKKFYRKAAEKLAGLKKTNEEVETLEEGVYSLTAWHKGREDRADLKDLLNKAKTSGIHGRVIDADDDLSGHTALVHFKTSDPKKMHAFYKEHLRGNTPEHVDYKDTHDFEKRARVDRAHGVKYGSHPAEIEEPGMKHVSWKNPDGHQVGRLEPHDGPQFHKTSTPYRIPGLHEPSEPDETPNRKEIASKFGSYTSKGGPRKTNEEAEPLDELKAIGKKSTLRAYVKKATKDIGQKLQHQGYVDRKMKEKDLIAGHWVGTKEGKAKREKEIADRAERGTVKRATGIRNAASRLNIGFAPEHERIRPKKSVKEEAVNEDQDGVYAVKAKATKKFSDMVGHEHKGVNYWTDGEKKSPLSGKHPGKPANSRFKLKVVKEDVLEESKGGYHSVFFKNDDKWCHHFDADNAEDAREEKDSIRRAGHRTISIVTPKGNNAHNWGTDKSKGQTDPHEFVTAHIKVKGLREEALDELSIKALAAYKAANKKESDIKDRAVSRGASLSTTSAEKLAKRRIGRKMAINKISGTPEVKVHATYEEVESIDEISKKGLANYATAAVDDVDAQSFVHGAGMHPNPSKENRARNDENERRISQRKKYLRKAIKRMSEDVEQLDEVGDTERGREWLKAYIAHPKTQWNHPRMLGGPGESPEENARRFKRGKGPYRAEKRIENNTPLPNAPKIHDVSHMSDGAVYDHTQTSSKIKNGDVLHMSGGRSAVMFHAWPTMVHGDSDALHKFGPKGAPKSHAVSVKVAKNIGGIVAAKERNKLKEETEIEEGRTYRADRDDYYSSKKRDGLLKATKKSSKAYRAARVQKRAVNEEQIDEISDKAKDNYVAATAQATRWGVDRDTKFYKRIKGMQRAMDGSLRHQAANKTQKEEIENIDEISKRLASDYSAKAVDDLEALDRIHRRNRQTGIPKKGFMRNFANNIENKLKYRARGIHNASKKIYGGAKVMSTEETRVEIDGTTTDTVSKEPTYRAALRGAADLLRHNYLVKKQIYRTDD